MTHSRRSVMTRLGVLAGVPLVASLSGPGDSASAATPRVDVDRIDVVRHGALADDSTDCSPAVRRAVAAIAARPGGAGVIWFPAGFYAFATPLHLPKNVILAGESPIATRLRYSGARTDAFITFGTPEHIATFSGLRSLWVNAATRARATVVLHGPQEGSTISETIAEGGTECVVDVRSAGIEGGSNKFVIDRSWLWTTGDDAVAGIRIGAGGGPLTVRDTTVVGTNRSKAPPRGSAGILATRSIITVDNVNVEHFDSHTRLDRTNAEIRGATGFFNRHGVVTTSASTAASLDVVNSEFDRADACIVDRGAGVTIRYCRSYSNESYRADRRHFRGNHWELGSANVYQSAQQQVTMGFTSRATGDPDSFKFTTLLKRGWRRSAQIDADGIFGTAGSGFDDAHLRLGEYHLWVDGKGRLRIRHGAPRHDRDGRAVGR